MSKELARRRQGGWKSPGEIALDAIQRIYDEYLVFPNEESRDAVCLWVLHTHVFRSFTHTPRLSVRGKEAGCGKSRVIEVMEHIVPNGIMGIDLSPATMWRLIENHEPTMLLDEVDTIFGKQGSGTSHSERRQILNAGHSVQGKVYRCVGSEDVKPFHVFGPVALAGIGRLPETLWTRSVEVQMRKRRKGDPKVSPFDPIHAMPELIKAKQMCEAFATDRVKEELAYASPEVPADNRYRDVWAPLIAVADASSEPWGVRARRACKLLVGEATAKPQSIGGQLLADVKVVFGTDHDRLFTWEIMHGLYALEDSLWSPDSFNAQKLARLLGEYGCTPIMLRKGKQGPARGYNRSMFEDVWDRFLDEEEDGS